jgi:hypothetical protein
MGRFLLVILLNLLVMQKPLFAREILGNTCKIALAVAKSNPVSKWLLRKLKNKILSRTFPIPLMPDHLTIGKAKDADELSRKQLDEMGIAYKSVDGNTYAKQLVSDKEMTADANALKSVSLYEISLPKIQTGKNNPATNTLSHPEFPAALEMIQKLGYKFYVDSSMSPTGVGGMVDPIAKTITIKADLDWLKFQHELRHIEYEEAKSLGLFDPENTQGIEAYPNFKDFVERAKEIRTRGWRDTTVHEMLATEREREILLENGYKAWTPIYKSKVEYSRRYQIGDILSLEPEKRTPQQLARLTKALIEFEAGLDFETTSFWRSLSPSKRVLILGALSAVGSGAAVYWYLNKDDDEKEVLIKNEDGEWIQIK